jgi:aspartyl-tRNA(Asn)/glutamyl-tRNA(Gln) amidotransferase subunit B
MRRKEGSDDYRYFPDPDLPPLIVEDAWIDEVRGTLVELPAAKRRRYREALGLTALDAAVITASQKLAAYFEEAAARHDNAKGIANWLMTEVLAAIPNEEALDSFAVKPVHLAELVALIDSGDITGTIGKKVFAEMVETGERPGSVVDRKSLRVVRDTDRLRSLVEETLANHPAQVEEYRAGKTKLLGFFVGQIMRATRGKADPKLVNRLLAEKLGESS